MGNNLWPTVASSYPGSILEHADTLQNELEAIDKHVRKKQASERISATLPHGLKKRISAGITKGVQEALSNGVLQKNTSDKEQKALHDTVLRCVTAEAAPKARDRIPLDLFASLLDSYSELLVKLWAHPAFRQRLKEPTPASFQDVKLEGQPRGRDEESEDGVSESSEAVVSDMDSDAQRLVEDFERTEDQGAALTARIRTMHQAVVALEDSNLEEEGSESRDNEVDNEEVDKDDEVDQDTDMVDLEYETDEHDSVANYSESSGLFVGSEMEEDDAIDDPFSRPLEGYQRSQKGSMTSTSENGKMQEVLHDELKESGAKGSQFVTLNITHQARVNRLQTMQQEEILESLSRSLGQLKTKEWRVLRDLQVISADLLPSGDVKVLVNSATADIPPIRKWISDWRYKFQKGLTPKYKPYRVKTSPVLFENMDLGSTIQKAITIKELAAGNVHRLPSLLALNGIMDIDWCHVGSEETGGIGAALVLDFSSPQQANEAIDYGVEWQGKNYTCEMLGRSGLLRRCDRCQALGHHSSEGCRAPLRCEKCAEPHRTTACTSKVRKCANCGGVHRASYKNCPIKKSTRQNGKPLRFYDPLTPSAPNELLSPMNSEATPSAAIHDRVLNSITSIRSASADRSGAEVKIEEDNAHPVTEQEESARAAPFLPLRYQPVEIKSEFRSPPTRQGTVDRLQALEGLRKDLDNLKATVEQLSELQRATNLKRPNDEAFRDRDFSYPNRNLKRTRQDDPDLAGPSNAQYPDYYVPQYN